MWHPLLNIKRAGQIEVCIHGRVAWFSHNKLIHSLSGEQPCFMRSLAKPIQMKAIAKELEEVLNPEEKALAISSHSGEERHVNLIKKMLSVDEQQNFVLKEARPYRKQYDNSAPCTKLHNNCSGKHSAIIKACQINHWSVKDYNLQTHPYHLAFLNKIRSYLGQNYSPNLTGIDGCQLPTISVKLSDIAKIYSIFCEEKDQDWIWQAMSSFPELIGGSDRIDSLIIKSCQGEVLAKEGAEGLLALSICNKKYPQGLGIVIKLAHGSDDRAMNYLAKDILESLGYSLALIYPATGQTVELEKSIKPQSL